MVENTETRNLFKDIIENEKPDLEVKNGLVYLLDGEYAEEYFDFTEDNKDLLQKCEEIELNKLIYGKNTLQEIVSLDVENDEIVIFFNDGTTRKLPQVRWILFDRAVDARCIRLRGNNHYKYLLKAKDAEEYSAFMKKYYRYKPYTIWDEKESAMVYYGITFFKGLKLEDVSVLSFDIEADGLVEHNKSEVYLITNTFTKQCETVKKHFRVDHYKNAGEMIDDWCKWVVEQDPTIINGHNIFGYDLRYLNHVAKLNNTSLKLGKDSREIEFKNKTSEYRVDGNQRWKYNRANIYGRQIVDGIFLSVKYDIGRNYPSWGLKHIAEYEGLVKEGRQFYDASKIKQNWNDPVEREKIVAYGIDDSDDSHNLYYLQAPSYFYMCQSIPKSFQQVVWSASGSWLNLIMVRAYLQKNHSIPKASEDEYVGGGMSWGNPGIYDNVSKWDAKSYYPSTIIAFDLYDKQKDPNAYYLKMVKHFTAKRFEQKNLHKETDDPYYDDLQAASKIFINSCYGLMATKGLNFNNYKIAQEITRCCRKGLQKCIEWATGKPYTNWWYADEPMYKRITCKKTEYESLYKKYEGALEIEKTEGDEYHLLVPRRQNKGVWQVTYSHSKAAKQDYNTYSEIDSKASIPYESMPKHDWVLVNIDTDSLSFAKKDGSKFTEEEFKQIHKEINQIMYSEWEDDGQFERFVVVKAKNYVMKENGKIKYKGSSITDAKKEPAIREMMTRLLDNFVDGNYKYKDLYQEYINEACNIKDISRWCVKKSISEKLLEGNDSSKKRVLAALEGKDFQVGNKVFLFNDIDGMKPEVKNGEIVILKSTGKPKMVENQIYRLQEDFTGSYDKWHYIERLYDSMKIFETILDMDKIVKYHLKSNRSLLDGIS